MSDRKATLEQFWENPSTTQETQIVGEFPTLKTASKYQDRQVAAGRVHILGSISFGKGRPLNVICRKPWKGLKLKHELLLTKALLPHFLQGYDFLRGFDVCPRLRPDAQYKDNCFEMDTGSESIPTVEKNMRKYVGYSGIVWFITATDERRDAVLRRTELLRDCFFATTLAWIKEQPFGEIWRNHRGKHSSIEL